MVNCGPAPDWDAEVWTGPGGSWSLPDDLTDQDRDWIRIHLYLAGARRNEMLGAISDMARLIRESVGQSIGYVFDATPPTTAELRPGRPPVDTSWIRTEQVRR
jgi:hypothetical protein